MIDASRSCVWVKKGGTRLMMMIVVSCIFFRICTKTTMTFNSWRSTMALHHHFSSSHVDDDDVVDDDDDDDQHHSYILNTFSMTRTFIFTCSSSV